MGSSWQLYRLAGLVKNADSIGRIARILHCNTILAKGAPIIFMGIFGAFGRLWVQGPKPCPAETVHIDPRAKLMRPPLRNTSRCAGSRAAGMKVAAEHRVIANYTFFGSSCCFQKCVEDPHLYEVP